MLFEPGAASTATIAAAAYQPSIRVRGSALPFTHTSDYGSVAAMRVANNARRMVSGSAPCCTIAAFSRSPGGGLVATGGQTVAHRALVVDLAPRSRLPAVYPYRF